MAAISVLAPIACASCQTKSEPVVITKFVRVELPPESRKTTPALSPKAHRDITQQEILDSWSADRAARNVGEYRRAACVAAVDAVK